MAPSAALVGSARSFEISPSIAPVSFKDATAAAALRFMSGEGMPVGMSSTAGLAMEVLHAMFLGQMNTVAKLVMLLGLVGVGGWLARPSGLTPLPASSPAPAARPQQAAAVKKEESPFRMTGTVGSRGPASRSRREGAR